MDIVKQRKRRLMAWILAIVLGVGAWHGSVQATEMIEKAVSGNQEILEEREATNEESGFEAGSVSDDIIEEPEKDLMYYYIEYRDDMENTDFKREVIHVNQEGTETTGQIIFSEDGFNSVELKDISPIISLIFKGTSKGTKGEYEHALKSWTVSYSGGAERGAGNTITAKESDNSSWSWELVTKLELFWEKIVVVINGDTAEEYYESKSQNVSDNNMKYETIKFPTEEEIPDSEIYDPETGLFFTEWYVQRSDREDIECMEGNEYLFFYDENQNHYTEINMIKQYRSDIVPRSGSFNLKDNFYILSDSYDEWTVNDDGYSYSGGIEFYSPGETYNFNAK